MTELRLKVEVMGGFRGCYNLGKDRVGSGCSIPAAAVLLGRRLEGAENRSNPGRDESANILRTLRWGLLEDSLLDESWPRNHARLVILLVSSVPYQARSPRGPSQLRGLR